MANKLVAYCEAPHTAAIDPANELIDKPITLELASLLSAHSAANPDFWAFKGNSDRRGSHGIFQYPAMMVPQLQGTLLDDLLKADSKVQTIYDPFAGSGTVIVEAMLRGLDIVAADINPMALLLCAVKARPLRAQTTAAAIERVVRMARQSSWACDVYFAGIDKWFTERAKSELCRLRTAIMSLRNMETRRFLWVCLAETIRLTSNSRTSTFKLHLYSSDDMVQRDPEPIRVFQEVADTHSHLLEDQAAQLVERQMLHKRRYINSLTLLLNDVRDESSYISGLQADALMTSPPYGDNQTTVPYGQHSYLPLQWINSADLPATTPVDRQRLLSDAYVLDRLSLGGSRVGADKVEQTIVEHSDSLDKMIRVLRSKDPSLRRKLISYAHDLDKSLAAITDRLRPGAFMFWTLGERRVGGVSIPLTQIVREMLEERSAIHVHTLQRQIPGNAKRMALRNDRGATMRKEAVLVMRTARR